VIGAIAAGHQAAKDIDAAIRMKNSEPAYEMPAEEKIDIPFIIDEASEEAPQMKMPELDGRARKLSFEEVELGFTREDAIREAVRCLRCDAEI
jgi:NADH-quinone oxidoreductase subunit F